MVQAMRGPVDMTVRKTAKYRAPAYCVGIAMRRM
jgi:hypothetical protein